MIRSMKQDLTFKETGSTVIQALGADVVTAHIVSIVSTGGVVKAHLQGTMDERPVASQVWYDLGLDVTINTSTYTVISHFVKDVTPGALPGCFRNYRVVFSGWGGVWVSCTLWLTAEGHEKENVPDTPLD